MKTVKEFETISKDFADARLVLSDRMRAMNDEIEAVKRKYLPIIRHAVNKAKSLKENLSNAIEESRDLFKRPKTMTVHGIKFGLQKVSDDIEWDDEETVINRIKKTMVGQINVLINTKETLCKTALKQLPAPDLKKIGVSLVEGKEQVLIKDTNSDIDKLVQKLLDEDKTAAENG